MRCDHGYELAGPRGVKCPSGCHGRVPAGYVIGSDDARADRVERTNAITNQQIVDALNQHRTIQSAADALGVNLETVRNRGKRCVEIREAMAGCVERRVGNG